MKLETNGRRNHIKYANTCKLNKELLSNQQVIEEIKKEARHFHNQMITLVHHAITYGTQ